MQVPINIGLESKIRLVSGLKQSEHRNLTDKEPPLRLELVSKTLYNVFGYRHESVFSAHRSINVFRNLLTPRGRKFHEFNG